MSFHKKASELTGLKTEVLAKQPLFDEDSVTMINLFLKRLPGPVCLVAHNGDKFDFPLLKAQIDRTGESLLRDVKCVDSLKVSNSHICVNTLLKVLCKSNFQYLIQHI